MGKTIAVINQKGGVGKSTTAQALTVGLSLRGYKTLIIDMDAQGNTSFTLQANREGATVLGVLLQEIPIAEAIQHKEHTDIIAASRSLAGADGLITETGKEYRLKEAIEPIKESYDYIILDTPPALSILVTNALTAADSVIIPAQADIYSLNGIADLIDTIKPVKKYCNPTLQIEGILLTRYAARSGFNTELMEIAESLASNLKTKVFRATIREAIAVKKAQASQQSIYDYDRTAKVTEDYTAFINELIGDEHQ